MKEKVIDFLKVAGISLLAFICVSPVNATNEVNAEWFQPLVFFTITYFLIDKYSRNDGLTLSLVGVASALGRIILEIPIRVIHLCTSHTSAIYSLLLTGESLLAIFMACVCWKYKKPVVFILSLVIFILINSFIPEMWSDFVHSRMDH